MGGYGRTFDGLLLIWTMDFIPKSVSWTCYVRFGVDKKKLNVTNILQYNKSLITIPLQYNYKTIT